MNQSPEPDHVPSPEDLVTRLHAVAGQLRRAWREEKTPENVNRIMDLGLHFRLLTDAYDAEVERVFPDTKGGAQ